MDTIFKPYADEVATLSASHSTTEPSYYPAIKTLLSNILEHEILPFEVRASTSESRVDGGHDQPDFALYDGNGDYLVVAGEVKLASEEIEDIAFSEERNDQIGRYLAQTGVVVVSNVRGFGLLTVRRDTHVKKGRVPPEHRVLEHVVELWPSKSSMEQRGRSLLRPSSNFSFSLKRQSRDTRLLRNRNRWRKFWPARQNVQRHSCRRNSRRQSGGLPMILAKHWVRAAPMSQSAPARHLRLTQECG